MRFIICFGIIALFALASAVPVVDNAVSDPLTELQATESSASLASSDAPGATTSSDASEAAAKSSAAKSSASSASADASQDTTSSNASGATMYSMTFGQHQLVYNFTSFTLACMMATTMFIWVRMWGVKEELRTAMCITGLVTFIAFYHYVRIFNSWVDAYKFPPSKDGTDENPRLTGIPFNDAYRYMDWLLTVPLLLMELVLVMDMTKEEKHKQSAILGTVSGLMILFGYPGELITQKDKLWQRWMFWAGSMLPFLYIVYTLLQGLGGAMAEETKKDDLRKTRVAPLIRNAQIMTVISWCTYPIVYIFPMLGLSGANAVVGIQIGYCVSDIISKCGVGLLTYTICTAKSDGRDGQYAPLA